MLNILYNTSYARQYQRAEQNNYFQTLNIRHISIYSLRGDWIKDIDKPELDRGMADLT
jgi:hypothetical protein